jgi:U3 small nucleolar ribonucleoprotein component
LKQSLEDKNWSLLGAAAHKMIPSFSIMGISPNFENMAKKIQEISVKEEYTDELNDLVTQLEAICDQACKELEEELDIIKNGI